MEDKQFTRLFKDFNPTLSDERLFMARLQERLIIIESILEYRSCLRREARKSIAVAGALGFLTGILFITLLPIIREFTTSILESLSPITTYITTSEVPMTSAVISWCLLAMAVISVSLSTYRFMFSRIKTPEI